MRDVADASRATRRCGPMVAAAVFAIAQSLSATAAGGDANGSVAYKGRTANLKFAYLVKGLTS
jgi:hypothetical protein